MTGLEYFPKTTTEITMNSKLRCFLVIGFGDVLFLFVIACILTLGMPSLAFAYVDPSVMTYTIQALAGVAVALSAVLGVAWRRFKRAIYKRLNIDENAGKLVEEPVKRIDPASEDAHHLLKEADKKAEETLFLLNGDYQQNIKWFPRFILSFFVSLFLIYTVGIVAPFEIVVNNSSSLQFGLNNVMQPLILFAVFLIAVLSFLISLIRGKAFNIVIGILCALGLCAYLQATFMNTGLPVADGKSVPWNDYTTMMFLTAIVWLMILAVAVILAIKNGGTMRASVAIVSVVLVLVQSIGLATFFVNPPLRSDGTNSLDARPFPTVDGLFEVASDNNIILFVLDTFDNDYLDEALIDDPEILTPFTGFIRFQNCSGSMIPTSFGMPSLITGQSLDGSDAGISNELLNMWVEDYNIIDLMNDNNISIDLYSTQYSAGIDKLKNKVDNFAQDMPSAPFFETIKELWRCAFYRDMPWVIKPAFWFYTGDVNTNILNGMLSGQSEESMPYTNDDVEYYRQLLDKGLRIDENSVESNGTFKEIHLDGTHFPYTMNENVERVDEKDNTVVQQAKGSLRIVSEYLDQLKRLGVYDNTTIIVTADHGKWLAANEITQPSSPIFLIKPAQEGSVQYSPIRYVSTPISHYDFAPTVAKIITGDTAQLGSGISVFDNIDPERRRYYFDTSVSITDRARWDRIVEYEINGNVQDWSAWKQTGNTWLNLDEHPTTE